MRAILDAIVDAFFGVIAFFANLSVSRYDDPVVAGLKRRKIACVVSACIIAIVMVLGIFVAGQLDALAASKALGPVSDAVRGPVAYAYLAAVVGSFLYACYTWYALWRFVRDGGGLDE